jgi:hypothetical protein
VTWVPKQPTRTGLVNELLIGCDDFRTAAQLADQLKFSLSHVTACLHHLYRYRAADFIEAEDALWWYATPDADQRCRVVDQRRPDHGRKRKAGYKIIRRGFHRD